MAPCEILSSPPPSPPLHIDPTCQVAPGSRLSLRFEARHRPQEDCDAHERRQRGGEQGCVHRGASDPRDARGDLGTFGRAGDWRCGILRMSNIRPPPPARYCLFVCLFACLFGWLDVCFVCLAARPHRLHPTRTRQAGMFALRERRQHVTQEDFEMAVSKVMKMLGRKLTPSLVGSVLFEDTPFCGFKGKPTGKPGPLRHNTTNCLKQATFDLLDFLCWSLWRASPEDRYRNGSELFPTTTMTRAPMCFCNTCFAPCTMKRSNLGIPEHDCC